MSFNNEFLKNITLEKIEQIIKEREFILLKESDSTSIGNQGEILQKELNLNNLYEDILQNYIQESERTIYSQEKKFFVMANLGMRNEGDYDMPKGLSQLMLVKEGEMIIIPTKEYLLIYNDNIKEFDVLKENLKKRCQSR